MDSISGFNINSMFSQSLDQVSQKGSDLNAKMAEIAQGDELSNEQMISLQFEIGQYNTLMEALSTITKSMTDMMKSIAQRSN